MATVMIKAGSVGGASVAIPILVTDAATGQVGQTGLTGQAIGTKVAFAGGVAGSFTGKVQFSSALGVSGVFANATGSIAETGLGNYDYYPSTGEQAAAGLLRFNAASAGNNTVDEYAQLVAVDHNDAVTFGVAGLALSGHNSGVRNESYDSVGNLTGADLCLYDSASHATTNDGATGLVHKYRMTFTYVSGRQGTQSIAQVS